MTNEDDFPKEMDPARRVENYAIAVRSGETELIGAIDQIIDEMRSGKLGELVEESASEFLAIQKGVQDAPRFDQRKDPSECKPG
jgi:ABC-type amino acid transport substrate-binding protein